ncbi:Calx-beta domain-containing protein [Paenibacillus sepulcri]|uniref:Calx-beta domain-containing protein n=1 Tax=Paenibacillus sepulcri TaxID=359917 RepID=A0ABS7BW59_9BACL|nr:hypothetical protein [Paenibacillus sepulcri]
MKGFKKNTFILLCGAMIAAVLFTLIGMKEVHAAGQGIHWENPYYGVTENDGFVTLTLKRSDVTRSASVNYGTCYANTSPAEPGADYDAESSQGSVTFNPGEASKTITIPIYDDSIEEFTYAGVNIYRGEVFCMQLDNSDYDPETYIYIWDNDSDKPEPAGKLTIYESYASVSEDSGYISILLTRRDGANGRITLDYTTFSEDEGDEASYPSASPGEDYLPVSGTLVFEDGEYWKRIDIPILNDREYEDGIGEIFHFKISNPTGGSSIDNSSTSITIVGDDDDIQYHNILLFNDSDPFGNVNENEAYYSVTVNRQYPTDGEIRVHYETQDGSAQSGLDYEAVTGLLIFAPGETSKTIRIPIFEDPFVEGPESFQIVLEETGEGDPVVIPYTHEVSILDNDEYASVQFASAVIYELEESKAVNVKMVRSGTSKGAVTVSYFTLSKTAKEDIDFIKSYGRVTFADGETSKSLRIPIVDDALIEYRESFGIILGPYQNVSIGAIAETEVVIYDQDHLKTTK